MARRTPKSAPAAAAAAPAALPAGVSPELMAMFAAFVQTHQAGGAAVAAPVAAAAPAKPAEPVPAAGTVLGEKAYADPKSDLGFRVTHKVGRHGRKYYTVDVTSGGKRVAQLANMDREGFKAVANAFRSAAAAAAIADMVAE